MLEFQSDTIREYEKLGELQLWSSPNLSHLTEGRKFYFKANMSSVRRAGRFEKPCSLHIIVKKVSKTLM